PKAARLGENAGEGAGDAQKVLELVDEEEEVWAPGFRERRAREDRLPDTADQERADERGGRVAPAPHREVREQDLPRVDDLTQVEGGVRLTEDATQARADEEIAQLVQRGSDHLGALRRREALVLVPKWAETDRIGKALEQSVAE